MLPATAHSLQGPMKHASALDWFFCRCRPRMPLQQCLLQAGSVTSAAGTAAKMSQSLPHPPRSRQQTGLTQLLHHVHNYM